MGDDSILVVDDNPQALRLATDILEIHGYPILQSDNGPAALELAKEHSLRLILLDISMPNMDGFELFNELRKLTHHSHTPIMALTALAMVSEQHKILRHGFDGYIPKPIDLKSFLGIVESAISKTKLETQ